MASSNKTANLNLNSWLESDRPSRSDFVRDNNIVDSILGNHIDHPKLHLSDSEKERVGAPYVFRVFQGTNEDIRIITFDFEPMIVIYFCLDGVQTEIISGQTFINYGIAVKNIGGSIGCSLSGKKLMVSQGTDSGYGINLNNSDLQYVAVAFR